MRRIGIKGSNISTKKGACGVVIIPGVGRVPLGAFRQLVRLIGTNTAITFCNALPSSIPKLVSLRRSEGGLFSLGSELEFMRGKGIYVTRCKGNGFVASKAVSSLVDRSKVVSRDVYGRKLRYIEQLGRSKGFCCFVLGPGSGRFSS